MLTWIQGGRVNGVEKAGDSFTTKRFNGGVEVGIQFIEEGIYVVLGNGLGDGLGVKADIIKRQETKSW